MFFTAKIHLVSGIVIGALAIMAAKQVCKQWKAHKQSNVTTNEEYGLLNEKIWVL